MLGFSNMKVLFIKKNGLKLGFNDLLSFNLVKLTRLGWRPVVGSQCFQIVMFYEGKDGM